MMAAAMRTQPAFVVGERFKLFEGVFEAEGVFPAYDVTRDGQSFIMVKPESESPQNIVVVLHWFEQLRAGKRGAAEIESGR